MKQCAHQFIVLHRESKYSPEHQKEKEENKNPMAVFMGDIYGIRVGCSLCGQNRIIWDTGELEIKKM